MPAIEVSHLTKEYRLGAMQSLKQTALNAGARLLGRPVQERPLFKALDDLSFTIEPGEVVGIIGHNGAGKSTLLKMLARISTPTHGSVKVNGRISPLIEVGAGFVPDFTGRENVYLNGSILGMPKKEIDRKFDEIVDFAEMAEFIDTPVKRYSSGMQVKLAFAVATSIESEILIVDEVLAVGDLAFQRKCFDRMEQLIRRQKRTVLMVSHNIRQVERICSRTILLDHGHIVADGKTKEVCARFFAAMDERILRSARQQIADPRIQSSGEVQLQRIAILDSDGNNVESVKHGTKVTVLVKLTSSSELTAPVFGIGVHTTDLLYLGTAITKPETIQQSVGPGSIEVRFTFDSFPFLPGPYALRFGFDAGAVRAPVFYAENLLQFLVVGQSLERDEASRGGFVPLVGSWNLNSSATDLPIHASAST